jgi:hypothetical protein
MWRFAPPRLPGARSVLTTLPVRLWQIEAISCPKIARLHRLKASIYGIRGRDYCVLSGLPLSSLALIDLATHSLAYVQFLVL